MQDRSARHHWEKFEKKRFNFRNKSLDFFYQHSPFWIKNNFYNILVGVLIFVGCFNIFLEVITIYGFFLQKSEAKRPQQVKINNINSPNNISQANVLQATIKPCDTSNSFDSVIWNRKKNACDYKKFRY